MNGKTGEHLPANLQCRRAVYGPLLHVGQSESHLSDRVEGDSLPGHEDSSARFLSPGQFATAAFYTGGPSFSFGVLTLSLPNFMKRLTAEICGMAVRYDPCRLPGWHRSFAEISTDGAGGSATFAR